MASYTKTTPMSQGGFMLTMIQTPESPQPGRHPGPWSPQEVWLILLVPALILVFLGVVFVRSRNRRR